MAEKTYAIILAGGTGERMGSPTPKQFLKLAGLTVIEHTLQIFENHPRVDEVFVVCSSPHLSLLEELLLRGTFRKVSKILSGGESRRESSRAGVMAVPGTDAKVLLHDAVRPFVSARIIDDCIEALDRFPAVDVAIPATDTIIEVDDMRCIAHIPPRHLLLRGQTPQAFRAGVIKEAHRRAAMEPCVTVTDDCGLILRYGLGAIAVVAGEEKNIKITHTEDLFLADKIFQLNTMRVDPRLALEQLKDKVVVIFGAAKGIGAATAYMARGHEARVHGFCRSSGVDIVDAEAVAQALAEVERKEGRIDYVVNTAGRLRLGRLADRDIREIRQEIEVNYIGALNVVRSCLPLLAKTRGSIALFTSSSFTRGRSLYTPYSSSKAAVVNLVQGVAEEMAPLGVRINAMNPERTATPMRSENFGLEPPETLLKPEVVAAATLRTLLSTFSGMVVDVRLTDASPEV
jgi:ribitol-5-phosphate 2-dehydrogenase (NADP+) / D-ribitol-5-phosphate cytidylyltransferase